MRGPFGSAAVAVFLGGRSLGLTTSVTTAFCHGMLDVVVFDNVTAYRP